MYQQQFQQGGRYPQQPSYPGMQMWGPPPKPPSTKIEGFPLLHFAAYISLVTTDAPRSELEQPITTLYLLAPYLGASSAMGSIGMPDSYFEDDVINPFNLKVKASSQEILRPKNGLKIQLKKRPYAFIGALLPDAYNSGGNKYPLWKGHIVWIGNSFDEPEVRNSLWLPGMGQPVVQPLQ